MPVLSNFGGWKDPSLSRVEVSVRQTSLTKPSCRIPEEATEKLISMFTLRPIVTDPTVIAKAVDSHPRRMNGFLTGCLLQVLQVIRGKSI